MLRTILLMSYSTMFCFTLLCLSGLGVAFNIVLTDHTLFAILFMFLFVINEVLVIFFFISTGKYIKEYCKNRKSDPETLRKAAVIKKRGIPPAGINIVLFTFVFTAGGSITALNLSVWMHAVPALLLLLLFYRTLPERRILLIENVKLLQSLNKNEADRTE